MIYLLIVKSHEIGISRANKKPKRKVNGKQDPIEIRAETMDFIKVCDKLTEIKEIIDKLNYTEQVITEIECCKPAYHMKTVEIVVPSNIGRDKKYPINVDGADLNTENILCILYNDRKKIRTTLLLAIEDLYFITGGTKTVTNTTANSKNINRGEAYEIITGKMTKVKTREKL